MEIFVSNIPFASTQDDIRQLFGRIRHRGTRQHHHRPRDRAARAASGFVGMPNDDEARAAIEALNGIELQGRALTINEARPREPRSNRRDW